MKRQSTIVALLTDFGLSDHYIGVMKAVILSRAPYVHIIDISHNVSPQNIDQAAYLLWASYKYFPRGTIFVCVVDPGVGSKRNIICATGQGYYFLAPDNGLLKYVLSEFPNLKTFLVSEDKFFLPDVSSTFHGRDIFAPVCAHLANGLTPSKLGKLVNPVTRPEKFVVVRTSERKKIIGRIIHIDRFGNLITNIKLDRKTKRTNLKKVRLEARGNKTTIRLNTFINYFSPTYSEAPSKMPFMIVGSNGLVEVSIKNGNAASFLKAKVGDQITLHFNHG